jgi:hypothetical protein
MKKFTISEERPATYTWIYEVWAENEEQALGMVMDGDVDAVDAFDSILNIDEDELSSEFKVEEVIELS